MSNNDRSDEGADSPPVIKVTDRRLFDRSGNLRTDEETPESSKSPESSAPRPSASEVRPGADADVEVDREPSAPDHSSDHSEDTLVYEALPDGSSPPAPPKHDEAALPDPESDDSQSVPDDRDHSGAPISPADEAPPSGAPSPSTLPRDLAGFVESQYFEALLYLGAIEHPSGGGPMEDIQMAQYKIDILEMLHKKTEGNREPEESKLFEDALYQLRMLFLEKSKVARL